MGRGNYIPPISSYSRADYETIYFYKDAIYGEDYWEDSNLDLELEYLDFKFNLLSFFENKFPSFNRVKREWLDNETRVIAENGLCQLTISDCQVYIAISVIAKEDDYNSGIVNLANKRLDNYAKALKDYALSTYGEYSQRNGAWTTETITKETA